jgi:hypothetical protein
MATSGNRTTYVVETPRTCVLTLFAHASGGGAGLSCTLDAQEALNGEVISVTFSSTGVYAVLFRYLYPELKGAPIVSFRAATTAGIHGVISAIDVTAGTATLSTFVGSVATDLATTDTFDLTWSVRNSGKNK